MTSCNMNSLETNLAGDIANTTAHRIGVIENGNF